MSSQPSSILSRLAVGSGFSAVVNQSRDAKLLCFQRFFRLYAYGASFLILVQFLSSLGISDAQVGLFMTLTLLGDVVISFVLTLITDQVGRRRVLVAGATLMLMSGVVFALSSNYWILVLASVVGVISPSGNEIGPFRAIEESVLAQLTEKDKRSDVFAWYTLFGTAGAALGTLTCGWAMQLLQDNSWSQTASFRVAFGTYAFLGMVKLVLTLMLSSAVEMETPYNEGTIELENEGLLSEDGSDEQNESPSTSYSHQQQRPPKPNMLAKARSLLPHISPLSRSILIRLILLFSIDSFASGLASPSWLTYFFTKVHHLEPASLGTLFLVTNILAALSNLVALPLARRIGLLKTMAFTHLPSAIFLGLIPFPPATTAGTWVAMALLSLRASTASMDQAPRQAFIAAAVLPSERTAVMGVVNVAKTLAQAGGLGSEGPAAKADLWKVSLGAAGGLKISYDLLILWMFLGLKDREEGHSGAGP